MVSSVLRAFPAEFADHIDMRGCPLPDPRPLPKLVDLGAGEAVYDTDYVRKQPDWTYAPVTDDA